MLIGMTHLAAGEEPSRLLEDAARAFRAGKHEEALALAGKAIAVEPKNRAALSFRAGVFESLEKFKDADADLTRAIELAPEEPEAIQRRGCVRFKRGQIEASIRDFDRVIELRPERKVSHWQRGISYYYAGRFDEGRKQFEGYQDYDSSDVENAIWRFMCMARKDGIEAARRAILKIGDDRRVPMRQVYDLYAGKLQPADVLAAARAEKPAASQLNRQLFYAHLYVGIYHDLLGERKQALDHLQQAVEHRVDHYMWDVARIRRDLLRRDAKR
jgi:lipoprotein NlpI